MPVGTQAASVNIALSSGYEDAGTEKRSLSLLWFLPWCSPSTKETAALFKCRRDKSCSGQGQRKRDLCVNLVKRI